MSLSWHPSITGLYSTIRSLKDSLVEKRFYSRKLILHGVGFRAYVKANNLNLDLGFTHRVRVDLGRTEFALVRRSRLYLYSSDKQSLNSIVHHIKAIKKLDPYKAKGVREVDCPVRLKIGKVRT